MNLPVIFDIAIGLVFIYLTLSLIASEIQELISTVLQWRAKHLKQSIELLMAGGSQTGSEEIEKAVELVKELYGDPIINTLNQQAKDGIEKGFRDVTKTIHSKVSKEKQSAPSYIPSETFAITLLETLKIPQLIEYVKNPSTQNNLRMILSTYKELKTGINDKNSESYQKIQAIYGDIEQNQKFKNLVNSLPEHVPDKLINSLTVIAERTRIKIDDLKEEANQFKKEVETWFDRSMDRSSGVYKRNAKGVAILIGIAIAILTNTDTFFLLNRLSRDSAIRSVITQRAIQQAESYPNDINVIRQAQQDLSDASVPIGWQNINQQLDLEPLNTSQGNTANAILRKIWKVIAMLCGWVVSGLAIAMGAPFWFDVLNKVINVRNAGPKPESYSKDQPPSN
jgi:arsenate reductase-like glutaredoxin family protein